jgi:23S rRNA pseudouridine1911/1915/1917 synthase
VISSRRRAGHARSRPAVVDVLEVLTVLDQDRPSAHDRAMSARPGSKRTPATRGGRSAKQADAARPEGKRSEGKRSGTSSEGKRSEGKRSGTSSERKRSEGARSEGARSEGPRSEGPRSEGPRSESPRKDTRPKSSRSGARPSRSGVRMPAVTEPSEPTLAAVVRERLGEGTTWSAARDLVRSGRAFVAGEQVTDPAQRVSPGVVTVDLEAPRIRRGVLPEDALVHVDRQVVVVAKPAGLLTVPYDTDDRDTLVDQLRAALRRRDKARAGKRYDPEVGVVHRLDKGTSGLLVFTRTVAAKRHLGQQFRAHTVQRTYLALVHGVPSRATHDTILVANRGDGLRGSFGRFRPGKGKPPPDARRAITHVDAVLPLKGVSLVAVRLETGRQHQIRIHLAEAGHPLVGENVYIRDYQGPRVEAARPLLHAAELGFVHPGAHGDDDEGAGGAPRHFLLEPPPDFIEALRRAGGRADAWRALLAERPPRRPRAMRRDDDDDD